jgi:hypothetical protein
VSEVRIRLPSRQKIAAFLTGSSTRLKPLNINLVCVCVSKDDSESIEHVPSFMLSDRSLGKLF